MTKKSIWTRPLTKRFWAISGFVVLAAFCGLVALPFVVADVEWAGHRNFMYRGIKIDLPFGWVYDRSGLPVTFERPKSFLASQLLDSSVWIERGEILDSVQGADATAKRRATYLNNWTKLFANGHSQTKEVVSIQNGGQRTLFCAEQPWLGKDVVSLHCVADDISWSFSYFGSTADVDDAKKMMKSVLSGSVQKR